MMGAAVSFSLSESSSSSSTLASSARILLLGVRVRSIVFRGEAAGVDVEDIIGEECCNIVYCCAKLIQAGYVKS